MNQDLTVPTAHVAPPPPPREMTKIVRRRAWKQPHVRFWWICAGVLYLIACGLATSALAEWNHERQLIRSGMAIDAVVQQAGEQTIPGRKQPPDTICILQFDWHGKEHVARPRALEGRTHFIAPRDVVRIFVNPNDPDDWTAATQPGPLNSRLVGAGIPLIVALLAMAMSLWLRMRVLRVWRTGQAIEALVVETQHSALAPFSPVVRCTPVEENDRRLFTVYIPARAGRLQQGDSLWLLARGSAASGAHAMAWFQ